MRVSYQWICELTSLNCTAEQLAEKLTFCGLEVESIEQVGRGFDRIVVGEIKSKKPHPTKDNLSVVEVDGGNGFHQVVCGAPNCPEEGKVVFAMPGAVVGDIEIQSTQTDRSWSHTTVSVTLMTEPHS